MIQIKKCNTGDTRTCDCKNVSKETLLQSSRDHIQDVGKALAMFMLMLRNSAEAHDRDKLTDIDGFYGDFQSGFERTEWWDRHRKLNRHHLVNFKTGEEQTDGVPDNVNLIDVLDYISDCVMAGLARSGFVSELKMPGDLLVRAFNNTVELLKSQVQVVDGAGTLNINGAGVDD